MNTLKILTMGGSRTRPLVFVN